MQRQRRNKSHLILLENTCQVQIQDLNIQTLFNRGRNKSTRQASSHNFPHRDKRVDWLSDLESENIIRRSLEEAKTQSALKLSWNAVCWWWWASDDQVGLIAEAEQVWPGETQTRGERATTMQIKLTTKSPHLPTGRQKWATKLESDYLLQCTRLHFHAFPLMYVCNISFFSSILF